jgi:hypothetical protein
MSEPIEDYLDQLQLRLRGTPRQIRRTMREAEDHLHDAAASGIAGGLDPAEAERAAVASFGEAGDIARECNTPQLVRGLLGPAAALIGIGLFAIGLSGVVAAIIVAAGGRAFTFADQFGATYPVGDCAHWMGQHPTAGTCAKAALAESVSDGLLQRFTAGILGLIVLATTAYLARRRGTSLWTLATRPITAVVGVAAFGVAALILLALGGNAIQLKGGLGAGQWLSAGVVAALAAAAFAVVAVRRLRELPALARL